MARYRVTLTKEEREALETMTRSGKIPAKKFMHARALLLCDAGEHGNPWKVADVAEALGVTPRTIEHLKQRFVEEGLESALVREPRNKPREVTFDGSFDARLTALACSEPPEGRKRWTIRLLADKAVELKIADSVSTMTVQRSLKKTNCVLTWLPTGRFHRTATPDSSRRWRICLRSIAFHTIRCSRWFAWTSPASS